MLDTEIPRLVDAILKPELGAQEEAFRQAIGKLENQATLDGLGRSSALLNAIHQENRRALDARADLVWSTIAKVASSCDLPWSVGVLADLRSAWRARFEPMVEKLAADQERRAILMGLGGLSLPDLRADATKIIGKTEATIELFERQLRRNPPRYLQPNVFTQETQWQLDSDTIKSEKSLEGIYRSLFNYPERRAVSYERAGKANDIIKSAIEAGDLLIGETNLYYYKELPGPTFTRIDPNTTDSRERDILATSPLYVRHELTLSPRKKRHLETMERLRLEKELDDDAGVELKPGWMGFSIDLKKLLRWLRRRRGR